MKERKGGFEEGKEEWDDLRRKLNRYLLGYVSWLRYS